jgi:hypothetical protein
MILQGFKQSEAFSRGMVISAMGSEDLVQWVPYLICAEYSVWVDDTFSRWIHPCSYQHWPHEWIRR